MGKRQLKGAALMAALLPFAAAYAEPEPAGQQSGRSPIAADAKKPSCVRSESGKAPKANPCPPGYVPAPGSKVPPVGSTDMDSASPGTPAEKSSKGGKAGDFGAGR